MKEEEIEVLETVKYLRENGLESLLKKFNLAQKRHSKYPNIIQLKYDQVDSDFNHQVVNECKKRFKNKN